MRKSSGTHNVSYNAYVRGNIIKWIEILLIIFVFIPIFSCGGLFKPIWAFFVYLNWESGLNLSRYSNNQMEIGIYVAIFQHIIGMLFAVVGSLFARAAKMEMGL